MKDAAQIYVRELRDGLDETLIPVFPPNTIVQVGSVGRIDDGRFIPRASLQEWGAQLDTVLEASAADMAYKSDGKVEFGPTVRVPGPGGNDLASATLKFTGDRSVAASFAGASSVRASLKDFDRVLYEQLAEGNLTTDDVVAWSVTTAESGAVVVAGKGGASIDVQAPIAGVVGFDTLGLGVTFVKDRGTSFHMSGEPVYVSVRLRRVTPHARRPVGDVLGLEPPSDTFNDVLVDDLLAS